MGILETFGRRRAHESSLSFTLAAEAHRLAEQIADARVRIYGLGAQPWADMTPPQKRAIIDQAAAVIDRRGIR